MPTYDYECENGHRFEVFQSMRDAALDKCVECGAPAKRRIGPGAGFLFRGDGFYSTDNRSPNYKEKAKAEAAPGAAGKSEGGSAQGEASSPAAKESAQPAAEKSPKKDPPPKKSSGSD